MWFSWKETPYNIPYLQQASGIGRESKKGGGGRGGRWGCEDKVFVMHDISRVCVCVCVHFVH